MTKGKYVSPRTETIIVCTENSLAVGTAVMYHATQAGDPKKAGSTITKTERDDERGPEVWGVDFE